MFRALTYRKLTDAQRVRIQALWYAGVNVRIIALRFGLVPATVSRVLREFGIQIPSRNSRKRVAL